MNRNEGYRPGDYWAICDISGRKVRASDTRKTWDGLRVAKEHWSPRHPQDFVRGKIDRQAVPDPRPPTTAVYQSPPGGPFFLVVNDAHIEAIGGQFLVIAGQAQPTPDSYGSGF